MNAQSFCGLVPVARCLLQYAQDVLPLQVIKPDAAGARLASQIAGKVRRLDPIVNAQQEDMVHHVLKLPDISRPGVMRQ